MSVAGKWKVTMDTPIGTQQLTWDLQPAHDGWQGVMESKAGTTALEHVEIHAGKISFTSRVDSPMGTIDLAFAGEFDGEQVRGTCRTLFGNSEFSGARA
jgi:hypothetical protein